MEKETHLIKGRRKLSYGGGVGGGGGLSENVDHYGWPRTKN